MTTIYLVDEFLLLEMEAELEQFDPFFEPDCLGNYGLEKPDSPPHDPSRWSYQVPCPGVKYYFFD